MPRTIQALRTAFALLAIALWSSAAGETLPVLNLDLKQTSVSGVSSGGYMAVQFAVAHSEIVVGVGVCSGGPCLCAAGGVTEAIGPCMQGSPDAARAVAETARAAAAGQIDSPENLNRQRVWLFSGLNDGVVKQPVMDSLYDYYRQYAPDHGIYCQNSLRAGHAMITESYGNACSFTGKEFINDCDYDGAGLLLQHIYGRLAPPTGSALSGEFIAFEQDAFVPGKSRLRGMAQEAHAYVPAPCAAGEPCRVHLAFHGCGQVRRRH